MIGADPEASFLLSILHGDDPRAAAKIFADWLDEQDRDEEAGPRRAEEAAAWRAAERGLRTSALRSMAAIKGGLRPVEQLSLVAHESEATLFALPSGRGPFLGAFVSVDSLGMIRWMSSLRDAQEKADQLQRLVLAIIGHVVDVVVRPVILARAVPILPPELLDFTRLNGHPPLSFTGVRIEYVEVRALAVAVGEHWVHHRYLSGCDANQVV